MKQETINKKPKFIFILLIVALMLLTNGCVSSFQSCNIKCQNLYYENFQYNSTEIPLACEFIDEENRNENCNPYQVKLTNNTALENMCFNKCLGVKE